MRTRRIIWIGVFGIFLGVGLVAYAGGQHAEPEEGFRFENRLAIPPLLDPIERNNQSVFRIELQEGYTEFFAGVRTPTWGANGPHLMPTIVMRRDEDVAFEVTNRLPETTTIHWHGMHLPAEMDGVYQTIAPGETWYPEWTVRQEAATLWYHPHLMGRTGEHVYNGLAGLILIHDENSDRLELPNTYGVDDIPVIVQDRSFDSDGALIYNKNDRDLYGYTGMLGDTILVNGTRAPYVDVPAGTVRLRVLNGSNARRFFFVFSDRREFRQIASDGGFLARPVVRDSMLLAPGERAEIVVDLSELAPVVLESHPIPTSKGQPRRFVERILGGERDESDAFPILELRPFPTSAVTTELPQVLNQIERWTEDEAVQFREFVLGSDTINGQRMDPRRIDFWVLRDTKEVWTISNPSGSYHPFHVHDVQFQILERNGQPPPEYERGWKDTVHLDQDETVRIILEFKDYSNPHVPYMYHCHILEHEDHGMMGQFIVVDEPLDHLPSLDQSAGDHSHHGMH